MICGVAALLFLEAGAALMLFVVVTTGKAIAGQHIDVESNLK